MTIANTFAAKASVAFVAIAMALMAVAPAQAATAEELQAQIDALMAQIAGLTSTTTTTSSSCGYTFTRALTMGSEGADVTALQNYLIGAGYAIPAGATGYFGAQTASAVAAWQTANGVTPAAGYFGPVSQAKYAMVAACADDSDDDMSDDDSTDDDSDDDSSSTDLQGEASLGDVDLKDGEDTDIEEGQEAAPVAEFEVEFDNGDAVISRLDVTLVDSGTEEDPWDTFEEVTLWVDGEEVASIDASDEDNYLDEDLGSLRFSGLDIVAMEDETTVITVGVTVQGSVDNMPATWNVDVEEIRYTDADDVTSTDDVTVATTDFEIQVEGADDELIIKSATADPDATTLQVEDDATSDMTTIFAFDLDSDDSTNDLELNTIVVGLKSGTADVEDIMNDAVLVIDGEEFDDYTLSTGATTDETLTFDIDGDYAIEAGERVTAELQVEFKKLDGVNYSAGETIQATTTPTGWDVEGADDLVVNTNLTGSASSEVHTLRVLGANLVAGDMTETLDANTDSTTNDDEGVFTLEFDVTAFETDLYIDKTAASTTGSTNGVSFLITNGSGDEAGTTTPSASLTSTAASETGTDSISRFVINEGETETFTLTVTFNPGITASAYYAVQLYSLNFQVTNTNVANVQQLALPVEDYETDPLSI